MKISLSLFLTIMAVSITKFLICFVNESNTKLTTESQWLSSKLCPQKAEFQQDSIFFALSKNSKNTHKTMAKKLSCRSLVFDNPIPDFSGGFPNESDVVRVFFWCERNAETNTSPSQNLDVVTEKLRDIVDIELKDRKKRNVAKVRICQTTSDLK